MFATDERPRRIRRTELSSDLARWLLEIEPGERLPTVRFFASRLRASLGATQGALSTLERAGAITVDRTGQRPGVLVGRSIGQLWQVAEDEPIVIALPLASTLTIQGLATAIKALLAEVSVDAFLVFARGSRRRLADLAHGRSHAAVMSSLSARERDAARFVVALELPAHSYVREHRVYRVPGEGGADRPLRVIVDRDSGDLANLSMLEFGSDGVETVSATYMQFARLLEERRADATVLDVEEIPGRLPPSVTSRALSKHVIDRIGDTNTRANVVVLRTARSAHRVLQAALVPNKLLDIQHEVMQGLRTPEY